ncbi:MAG: acyl carrier protein [Gemmobacter sp.]
MTEDSIRQGIIEEVIGIAPDTEAASVTDTAHLLDDLGLDSMDFLNLVAALQARFGVTIAEIDFPRLTNVAALQSHIAERLR